MWKVFTWSGDHFWFLSKYGWRRGRNQTARTRELGGKQRSAVREALQGLLAVKGRSWVGYVAERHKVLLNLWETWTMGMETAEETWKHKKYVKEGDKPWILFWRHVHCTIKYIKYKGQFLLYKYDMYIICLCVPYVIHWHLKMYRKCLENFFFLFRKNGVEWAVGWRDSTLYTSVLWK